MTNRYGRKTQKLTNIFTDFSATFVMPQEYQKKVETVNGYIFVILLWVVIDRNEYSRN